MSILFDHAFDALIVGSNGGIGSAITTLLNHAENCRSVTEINREFYPDFDITNEEKIAKIAEHFTSKNKSFDLIFDATGGLEIEGVAPEKSFRQLTQNSIENQFKLNAMGPALLLKYFLPLMPRKQKTIFATLSARVGSISDNRLGGWMSYRASKAALNQFVKCAAIEQSRRNEKSIIVTLHPGTVATSLSEKYAGNRDVFTPEQSASKLVNVLAQLAAYNSGDFFAYDGQKIEF